MCCRRAVTSPGVDEAQYVSTPLESPKTDSDGFRSAVLPTSEIMKSFNGLSWVQKSLYRSLVPPGPDELKRPRRPCMWACVAYTTAALVVLSCAFFVVAFGFRFGPIVSRAFMVSAVVSFLLSGLIVQPIPSLCLRSFGTACSERSSLAISFPTFALLTATTFKSWCSTMGAQRLLQRC